MADEFSNLPRNFTVTTDERMRALVAGLPAYVRRRRRIEDLESALIRRLRAYAQTKKTPVVEAAPPAALVRALETLRALVDAHNRYYPIEADLPIDRATGEPLDGGEPWVPMAPPSFETLLARAGELRR